MVCLNISIYQEKRKTLKLSPRKIKYYIDKNNASLNIMRIIVKKKNIHKACDRNLIKRRIKGVLMGFYKVNKIANAQKDKILIISYKINYVAEYNIIAEEIQSQLTHLSLYGQ